MSTLISKIFNQFCKPKQFRFKDLPIDIQYKIFFEYLKIDVNPYIFKKSLPELICEYNRRVAKKSYKHFKDAKNNSLAGTTWIKINLELERNNILINDCSYEEIAILALNILSKKIPFKKYQEISNKWGAYSLRCEKFCEIEKSIQALFDRSLEMMWKRVFISLSKLTTKELPTKADKIRSWLTDPKNLQPLKEIYKIDLSDLNLNKIPPEIKFFENLTSLDISNNNLKNITPLKPLKHLSKINISSNPILLNAVFKQADNLKYISNIQYSLHQVRPLVTKNLKYSDYIDQVKDNYRR